MSHENVNNILRDYHGFGPYVETSNTARRLNYEFDNETSKINIYLDVFNPDITMSGGIAFEQMNIVLSNDAFESLDSTIHTFTINPEFTTNDFSVHYHDAVDSQDFHYSASHFSSESSPSKYNMISITHSSYYRTESERLDDFNNQVEYSSGVSGSNGRVHIGSIDGFDSADSLTIWNAYSGSGGFVGDLENLQYQYVEKSFVPFSFDGLQDLVDNGFQYGAGDSLGPISFENFQVDGDNISFDIHLNRTYGFEHVSGGSDAGFYTLQGVKEIKLLGKFDTSYESSLITDAWGHNVLIDNSTIKIGDYNSGPGVLPFNLGKVATFSAKAGFFGLDNEDGIDGWQISDLYSSQTGSLEDGSRVFDHFGFYDDPQGNTSYILTDEFEGYYNTSEAIPIIQGESTPTPTGPSYSHIGNTNNSSSTVEVTDTEYAQNTGSVEFIQFQGSTSRGNNQYDWTRMQIDETSLYVDNGGTDDWDNTDNTIAAPTPEDDQTMGVYVNMRDGLASALVPGVNEVTIANAATINQHMTMPSSNIYAMTHLFEAIDDMGTADTADDMVWGHNLQISIGIDDPSLLGSTTYTGFNIVVEDQGLYNLLPPPDSMIGEGLSEPSLYPGNMHVRGGVSPSGNEFHVADYSPNDPDSENNYILLGRNDYDNDGNPVWLTGAEMMGIDEEVSIGEYNVTFNMPSTNFSYPDVLTTGGDTFHYINLRVALDNGPVLYSDYVNDPGIYTSEIDHWADPNTAGQVVAYQFNDTTPIRGEVGTYGSGVQTIHTLDAVSIEDPMNLPWEVELSSSDDIYIGRDDVDNEDGTYTTTTEGVAFSRGNDDIDMGLGYNYAVFNNNNEISQLEVNLGYWPGDGSSNVTVTMGDGEVYNQRWVGVNEVWGSNSGYNTLIGSDNDPYNMPSDDVGFFKISEDGGTSYDTYTAGEFGDNYLVAMGGASYLAGQGGDDTLNAYVSHDYYFDNADLIQMWPGSEMYGGEGNDTLAGGVLNDSLAGGQNPENNYQIDSDDFYNDIGHDFAFIGFDSDNYGTVYSPSASTLKAVSSIMINGEAIAIDTSAIADDGSMYGEQLYDAFSDAVNAAINAHFGNTEQLWEYLSVSHDENNVADGFVLKYAQGLDKPEGAQSYAYSGEQVHHGEVMLPSWAPELQSSSGSTILAANMYAKASEFVEGSGDDNDRFVYYRDDHINAENYGSVENGDFYDNANLNAIRGDIIADLDIGQNSLSLRAEEGEGIWFDAGVINHNSVVIDLSYVPENTVDMIDAYYTADVSLTDVNGDTSTFTLGELNLPTTALYGDQDYELAYTWETVGIQTGTFGNFIGESTNTEDVWMDKDVDVLRFEWQAVGEKVGSEGDDALTGSNGSNVFAAFGGDDVLNGSGGGDSYQFMGNFGKDKVLEYGDGTDILQIGAAREDVWFERLGRRGDELKVTVNDGTHMGTISVGRQYNPYSAMQAVEEIHFGFDGAVSDDSLTISNGEQWNYSNINVLRNGEDNISIMNVTDNQYVYFNSHETQGGTTTLALDFYNYFDTFRGTGTVFNEFGFFANYGNGESDYIRVDSAEPKESYESYETIMPVPWTLNLVSKHAIDVQEGTFNGVQITETTAGESWSVTKLADSNVSESIDELLFTLQWEDASSYGI